MSDRESLARVRENFEHLTLECMKIWCCLCFSEEDESGGEEDNKAEAMDEVDFENEGNFEVVIGNDGENGDVPGMELAAAGGADGLDPDGREPDQDDRLRLFEGMVQAVRVGAGVHWDDSISVDALATLKASMRTSRRSKGESSSASSAVASEDCDHDSQHKRAKVHSDFQ